MQLLYPAVSPQEHGRQPVGHDQAAPRAFGYRLQDSEPVAGFDPLALCQQFLHGGPLVQRPAWPVVAAEREGEPLLVVTDRYPHRAGPPLPPNLQRA